MRTRTVYFAACLAAIVTTAALASTAQIRSRFNIDIAGLPESLKSLCERSTYIVDAHVISVFAATEDFSPKVFIKLETDALISVDRVLKGDVASATLVISQLGGIKDGTEVFSSQFDRFQTGQRYILFLSKPPEMDRLHADRPGLQRHYIYAVYSGMLRVDEGKVYPNRGTPSQFQNAVFGKPAT